MAELLDQATRQPTAMMCSESVWWRCHRRLVADLAVLKVEAVPADGARPRSDGQVVWDVDRGDE